MGMHSPRPRPLLKVGDTVLLREGIVAHIYDINAEATCVYVNWVEGRKDTMQKAAVDVSGTPDTWALLKVEPAK